MQGHAESTLDSVGVPFTRDVRSSFCRAQPELTPIPEHICLSDP
jgi:hypothetical protein